MKKDPEIEKQIKHIGTGIGVLGILDVLVLALIEGIKFSTAWFILGGCIVALLGFIWLCASVQSTLEKAQEKGSAKGLMTKSYIGRMALNAGWVVLVVILAPTSVSKITGAIPVLFPSFTIKIMNLFKKDKDQ